MLKSPRKHSWENLEEKAQINSPSRNNNKIPLPLSNRARVLSRRQTFYQIYVVHSRLCRFQLHSEIIDFLKTLKR